MAVDDAIQVIEPAPRRMPLRWPRGATWITFVCASVCLSVGADLMQMFAEFDKALALANLRAGGVGLERYTQAQHLSTLLSVILLVLFIPVTAIALRWLAITYRNLYGLQVQGLTYGPTGAIKACLWPTRWLNEPCRLVQEIWRASDPALPACSDAWRAQPNRWLIRIWWLLFLGRCVRTNIGFTPLPLDSPGLLLALQVAAWCAVASAAMGAAAGVLFIVIVLRIERRQWQRYDQLPW